MKEKILTKADYILAVVLLAVGLAAPFAMPKKAEPKTVTISVDGRTFGSYPIEKDASIDVNGGNLVVIEGGEVFVKEASCRGLDCVQTGRISKCGQSIICLPNRVVISIEGESELDAVIK